MHYFFFKLFIYLFLVMRIIALWNKLSWEEVNFPCLELRTSRQNAFLENGLQLTTNSMSRCREVCDTPQVKLNNIRLIVLSDPEIYESGLSNLYICQSLIHLEPHFEPLHNSELPDTYGIQFLVCSYFWKQCHSIPPALKHFFQSLHSKI